MVRASASPNGNRNSGAGFSPVTEAICCAPPRICCRTVASPSRVRYGWLIVWSPIRKPPAAIDRAAAGKSRTKFPVRKNVAGTPSRRRVARMDGTASALAPASKVSATTRRVVGMTVQSFPASQPVTGRVPGGARLVPGGARLVPGGEGLVAGGRAEGAAGGTVLAGVAPGADVPPQAASAATAAPSKASRVISRVLMPSACAGPGGPERSEGPVSGVYGHPDRTVMGKLTLRDL